MRSFERVTGNKVDKWLVKMAAMLIITIAGTLLVSLCTASINIATVALSLFSASSFIIIDINYALKKRISKIYLADAAIEFLFIAGWIIILINF
jgi:hypothetical protein